MFKKFERNKTKKMQPKALKKPRKLKVPKLFKVKKYNKKEKESIHKSKNSKEKKSISLQHKLIGSLVIFASLPVLVVSILSAQANSKAIENSVGSYSQSMVEQFGHSFNGIIDQTRNTLTQFMLMDDIQRATLKLSGGDVYENYLMQVKIEEELQGLLNGNNMLNGVIIANNQGKLYYKDSRHGALQREVQIIENGGLFESQRAEEMRAETGPIWIGLLDDPTVEDPGADAAGIYLGWQYKARTSDGQEGIMLASIERKQIQELIDVFSIEGVSEFYIADENERIIIGPEEENIGGLLEVDYIDSVYGQEKSHTFVEGGKLVSFYTMKNGWKAIYEAPLNVLMADVIKAQNKTVVVGVICILLAIIIGFIIATSILRPIKRLSDAMAEAETGNLAVEFNYKSNNEIGRLVRSFNQMINNIKALVLDTKNVAETIESNTETLQVVSESTASSSNQITQAIESIASGTENQTVQIVQSTEMMENLSENINLATQKVQGVQEVANSTMKVSNDTVSTMAELTAQSEKTIKISSEIEKHIEELGDEASQITNVIGMIQSISEQTNLLALNATIEAARAGDAGRGFGVVADEIRKLANQSKEATSRIEQIIASIMNKKDTSIQGARDATNLIALQRPIVDNTNQAFEKIHEEMERVVTQLDELRDLFGSITSYKDDTLVAITEISDIIGHSASAAEEVFATSAEQSTAADSMAKMVNELYRGVEELKFSQEKFRL